MKTRKIFLAIVIFVMGFMVTASSKELEPNPVVTNIEFNNELIEVSNLLINDPFCDTDYVVERQRELMMEYWGQQHKDCKQSFNDNEKNGKKQHGKHKGKGECKMKECKKDCPNKKEFSKEKEIGKRGEFRKDFGRPMFHENDSIKFEHPKR